MPVYPMLALDLICYLWSPEKDVPYRSDVTINGVEAVHGAGGRGSGEVEERSADKTHMRTQSAVIEVARCITISGSQ
jgi:hypothetical protein